MAQEGLAYAAKRSSLWLGSDWNESEIAQLRAANGGTIVLTSINACETTREDLPDDYYLTNVTRPAGLARSLTHTLARSLSLSFCLTHALPPAPPVHTHQTRKAGCNRGLELGGWT